MIISLFIFMDTTTITATLGNVVLVYLCVCVQCILLRIRDFKLRKIGNVLEVCETTLTSKKRGMNIIVSRPILQFPFIREWLESDY